MPASYTVLRGEVDGTAVVVIDPIEGRVGGNWNQGKPPAETLAAARGWSDNQRQPVMTPRLPLPEAAIAEFCRRWAITEFALFGSVLRDDFGPDSDIDVLVSFAPGVRHSLFDLVHMEDELRAVFGRHVDLVTRRAIERSTNEWRRDTILGSLAHVALAS